VARLEGQLEAIYRMAVLVQRREPDMDAALAVWEALVGICDSFLFKLGSVEARPPRPARLPR